jgi:molecular chaperone DnaK
VAKGDDAEAIKKAGEGLMEAAQTIGKIMYEEAARAQSAAGGPGAGPAPGGGAESPGSAKEDDVIDAEYEVKK